MIILCLNLTQGEEYGSPGAISVYLNTVSLNNIIQSMVPVLLAVQLANKTLELGVSKIDTYTETIIDSVYIKNIKAGKPYIGFIDGTDTLEFKLPNLNTEVEINGEFNIINILHVTFYKALVKNLNYGMQLKLEQSPSHRWQILSSGEMTIEDAQVEFKNALINWLLNTFSSTIKTILDNILPSLANAPGMFFAKLNAKVGMEIPLYSDILHSRNYFLDLTPTKVPEFNGINKEINIHLNGLTYDLKEDTTHIENINTVMPPKYSHSHSQQFWIHESLLSSLLYALFGKYSPMLITDQQITQHILELFPEIISYYGTNAKISLSVTGQAQGQTPIKFSSTKGMIYGDEDSIKLEVIVLVASKGTLYKQCLKFGFDIKVVADVHLQNLILNHTITEAEVQNVKIIEDNVGLPRGRKYQEVFQNVINEWVAQLNHDTYGGFDVTSIDPRTGMVGGLIKNTTMTPYQLNEFMYMGFTFAFDKQTVKDEVEELKVENTFMSLFDYLKEIL